MCGFAIRLAKFLSVLRAGVDDKLNSCSLEGCVNQGGSQMSPSEESAQAASARCGFVLWSRVTAMASVIARPCSSTAVTVGIVLLLALCLPYFSFF